VESSRDIREQLFYGGPSPDEITLVDAAKNMGFVFVGSTGNEINLKIKSREGWIDKQVILI
jgi:phospholipid-transporting ATPase